MRSSDGHLFCVCVCLQRANVTGMDESLHAAAAVWGTVVFMLAFPAMLIFVLLTPTLT